MHSYRMRIAHMLLYGRGLCVSVTETTPDRDPPPGQRVTFWTETPLGRDTLDRDPLDRETLDKDPLSTETPHPK